MSSVGWTPGGQEPTRPLLPAEADRRFRELVEAHRGAVLRYIGRLGVPPAEIEDAVQEVFVVLASRLPILDPGTERAFLYATAVRVSQNSRRGQRRRQRMSGKLIEHPMEPLPGADVLADHHRARAMVEEALEQLPGDARLVYLLCELHEMPLGRIAERLGLPEGTVASRLRRARKILGEWSARFSAGAAFDRERARALGGRNEAARDPEVLSWWVSRGETDALRALLGIYNRTHPNAPVLSAAVSGTPAAREQLRARMTRGLPPDTFQVNGGTDLFAWVGSGAVRERMEPLDFLFSAEGWNAAFPADVLDLVTHAGRPYAVPVDIHRINTLFFNRRLLADSGLEPPTTLDEMHEVAGALQARGVVPIAIGYKHPWTLSSLAFENVMVAVAGGEYYRDFFTGKRGPDEPELRATLHHVGRILDYANADAHKLGWDGAVELLCTGRAAMTIMGDWAKGYLTSRGFPFEFGELPSPGSGNAFVFATDTFGLPRRATQRTGAIELLRVFGSREGQDAFNPLKGSIPARTDADLTRYDPLAQATVLDFWSSPRYPSIPSIAPSAFTQALDRAMLAFARNRDAGAVVDVVRAHYDLLVHRAGRAPYW